METILGILVTMLILVTFKPTNRLIRLSWAYPKMKIGGIFDQKGTFSTGYEAEILDIFLNNDGVRTVRYITYQAWDKEFTKFERYCPYKYFAVKYIIQDDKWSEEILNKL